MKQATLSTPSADKHSKPPVAAASVTAPSPAQFPA